MSWKCSLPRADRKPVSTGNQPSGRDDNWRLQENFFLLAALGTTIALRVSRVKATQTYSTVQCGAL